MKAVYASAVNHDDPLSVLAVGEQGVARGGPQRRRLIGLQQTADIFTRLHGADI